MILLTNPTRLFRLVDLRHDRRCLVDFGVPSLRQVLYPAPGPLHAYPQLRSQAADEAEEIPRVFSLKARPLVGARGKTSRSPGWKTGGSGVTMPPMAN